MTQTCQRFTVLFVLSIGGFLSVLEKSSVNFYFSNKIMHYRMGISYIKQVNITN
jgi:hypothetical protein